MGDTGNNVSTLGKPLAYFDCVLIINSRLGINSNLSNLNDINVRGISSLCLFLSRLIQVRSEFIIGFVIKALVNTGKTKVELFKPPPHCLSQPTIVMGDTVLENCSNYESCYRFRHGVCTIYRCFR